MTTLLVPVDVAVAALNIALTSVVACCLAMIVSRQENLSLPFRNAVLVAALIVCAAAPVLAVTSTKLSLRMFPRKADWFLQSEPVPVSDVPQYVRNDPMRRDVQPVDADFGDQEDPFLETRQPSITSPARMPSASAPHRPAWPWWRMLSTSLLVVWLSGSASVLLRTMKTQRTLSRLLNPCCPLSDQRVSCLVEDVAAELRLQSIPLLLSSDACPVPVLLSRWQLKLIFPVNMNGLSTSQLRLLIRHELAHIVRRDNWVQFLQLTTHILYWWNPLVRAVNVQVSDLRELICDDIATADGDEVDEYCRMLVDFAERTAGFALARGTLGFGSSQTSKLEHRIRRLYELDAATKRTYLTRAGRCGTLASVLVMSAGSLVAQLPGPPSQQPDKSQTAAPSGSKLEDPGKPAKYSPVTPTSDRMDAFVSFCGETSRRQKANLDSLQMWKATYRFEDRRLIRDDAWSRPRDVSVPFWEVGTGKVHFLIDLEHDRLFLTMDGLTITAIDVATGGKQRVGSSPAQSIAATPDVVFSRLSLSEGQPPLFVRYSGTSFQPPQLPNRFWRTRIPFDPAELFSPGNTLPIHQKMATWPDLIRAARPPQLEDIVPRVDMEHGEWVLSTRTTGGNFFEYRFDDTEARNWLSCTSFERSRICVSTRAKWTKAADAYVPQEYEHIAYESNSELMQHRRFLALESSEVRPACPMTTLATQRLVLVKVLGWLTMI